MLVLIDVIFQVYYKTILNDDNPNIFQCSLLSNHPKSSKDSVSKFKLNIKRVNPENCDMIQNKKQIYN